MHVCSLHLPLDYLFQIFLQSILRGQMQQYHPSTLISFSVQCNVEEHQTVWPSFLTMDAKLAQSLVPYLDYTKWKTMWELLCLFLSLQAPTQWRIWAHSQHTASSHETSRLAHFEAAQLANNALTRWSHSGDLLVSPPWVHLTQVSLLWPICEINRWAQQAVIAVWSLWSNY